MDKFVVDLDQVLDDFEKSEEAARVRSPSDLRSNSSGYDSLKASSDFTLSLDRQISVSNSSPGTITSVSSCSSTPPAPDLNTSQVPANDSGCDLTDSSHLDNGLVAHENVLHRHQVDDLTPTSDNKTSNNFPVALNISIEEQNIYENDSHGYDDSLPADVQAMTSSEDNKTSVIPSIPSHNSDIQDIEEVDIVSHSVSTVTATPQITFPFKSSVAEMMEDDVASDPKTILPQFTGLPGPPSIDFVDSCPPDVPGMPGPPQTDVNVPVVIQLNKPSFRRPTSLAKSGSNLVPTTPTTPSEDIGFTRVPGMPSPHGTSTRDILESPSTTSLPTILRPTSPPSQASMPPKKKARPNSLLGLSVPTRPADLVRIEQEKQRKVADNFSTDDTSIPGSENRPPALRRFTLNLPPTSTSSRDLSLSPQPGSKPPVSPMDCYEEIENPLYRSTVSTPSVLPRLTSPSLVLTTHDSPSVEVEPQANPSVSPTKSGVRRPSFLPIATRQGQGGDTGGSSHSAESPLIGQQPPSVDSLATPDTVSSPAIHSDSISGDSPTASIASSASSAWSGIQDEDIGRREPQWAQDESSLQCMACSAKFTVFRRRHHCRACGKLLCAQCCGWKSRLQFIKASSKLARVCAKCYQQLVRLESNNTRSAAGVAPPPRSGTQQPPSSLLKRHLSLVGPSTPGSTNPTLPGGGKSVMFSDGIRPGGDLSELDSTGRISTPTRPLDPSSGHPGRVMESLEGPKVSQEDDDSLIPPSSSDKSQLPPLIVQSSQELILQSDPDSESLVTQFTAQYNASLSTEPSLEAIPCHPPVVFAVTRNLHILVSRLHLGCCVGQTVWCFVSRGLETVGQEEVVILLECAREENLPPSDIFRHYYNLYQEAKTTATPDKKSPFSEHSCLLSHLGLFGEKSWAGFLYTRPTYQCLQQLSHLFPPQAFLVGLLVHRWEAPWAKLFPLRLLLRLGIEARYYPAPLVSRRDRAPVFAEIGRTVLQLLVDFRDFRYGLSVLPGLCIHLSTGHTRLHIPRWSYSALMKLLSERQDNSYMLALGGVQSGVADSHLVCVQREEDSSYLTQAISIENTVRTVTGASFIVFNGGQRQTRSCIVEDGVIVQLKEAQFTELLAKLKSLQPCSFLCDPPGQPSSDPGNDESRDSISIIWEDETCASGILSPPLSWIDSRPLSEPDANTLPLSHIMRVPPDHQLFHWNRITSSSAALSTSSSLKITWTRVYTLQSPPECEDNSTGEPVDTGRLADEIAEAFISALGPHLGALRDVDLVRLGLRVTLDPDLVGYETGCSSLETDTRGQPLPAFCLNDLDNCLVPILHPRASHIRNGPLVLELCFHILD